MWNVGRIDLVFHVLGAQYQPEQAYSIEKKGILHNITQHRTIRVSPNLRSSDLFM